MIPLYGFREGDTIGLLVLAEETESVRSIGEKLQRSASVRVAPALKFKVIYKGHELDLASTVAAARIAPLERFDVIGVPL